MNKWILRIEEAIELVVILNNNQVSTLLRFPIKPNGCAMFYVYDAIRLET